MQFAIVDARDIVHWRRGVLIDVRDDQYDAGWCTECFLASGAPRWDSLCGWARLHLNWGDVTCLMCLVARGRR